MTLRAELNVDEITNSDAKKMLEDKLKALDGVSRLSFDVKNREIKIDYDEAKINLVDIKQSIMEEGYTVIEI